MRLKEIIAITQSCVYTPGIDMDCEVIHAFASDLMSDVLCYDVTRGLLITGLINPQMLRTAEMADVAAVLIVRDKQPPSETIKLAQELGIPLLGTRVTMFEACGLLFQAGLRPCQWRNGEC
ncbi:MAG: transcriptional regulator [Ardenticatenia bacterium]|jgi:predicted transcriptional regulator|nr:MAG: transcriptional regulator [Ardenticatenia bacterium]